MSYATALEALRDLVVALSGVSDTLVLLAYGDLGRPASAHMTLQLVRDVPVGWAQRTGTTTTAQERQARIQIDAYGQSAVDGLRKTATLLQSSDARVLAATGIAIQGVGDTRNTTAIWMTKYEARATLEVLMGYAVVYTSTDPTTATSIGLDIHAPDITIEIPDAAP